VKSFNRGVSAAESWSPSIKSRIGISAPALMDKCTTIRRFPDSVGFVTQSSKTGKSCSPPRHVCSSWDRFSYPDKLFYCWKWDFDDVRL